MHRALLEGLAAGCPERWLSAEPEAAGELGAGVLRSWEKAAVPPRTWTQRAGGHRQRTDASSAQTAPPFPAEMQFC